MIEGECCICQSERSFFDVCHIILFPSPGTFDWLADNSFVLIVTEVGGYAEFEIFSPPCGFIMAAASQPRLLARLLVGNYGSAPANNSLKSKLRAKFSYICCIVSHEASTSGYCSRELER